MTQVVRLYELIGQFINEKRAPASFYEVLQTKVANSKPAEAYFLEDATAGMVSGAFQNMWEHFNKDMRQYQPDEEEGNDEADLQEMITNTLSALDEIAELKENTKGMLVPSLKLSCLHYAVLVGAPLILLHKALQMCPEETRTAEDIYGFTPVHYAAIIYKSDSEVLRDHFFQSNMDLKSNKLKITPRQIQTITEEYYTETPFLSKNHMLTFFEDGKLTKKKSTELHWGDEDLDDTPCTYINSDLISTSLFKRVFSKKNADKEYLEFTPAISGEENVVIAKVNDIVGHGLFAKRDFKEGEIVCHFLGKLDISYSEFTFNDNYGLANDDILCYGEQYRSLAMLINHSSKKNNVEVRVRQSSIIPRLEVVVMRDIKEGDQLFLDYGQEWFEGRNLQEIEIDIAHVNWNNK